MIKSRRHTPNIGVDPYNAGGALYLFAPNTSGRYSFQVKADGYSGIWDDMRQIWLYAFDANGYMAFGTQPPSGVGVGQIWQKFNVGR